MIKKKLAIFFLIIISVICSGFPVISGKFISFGIGENGFHEKFGLGYYQIYPEYLFDIKKFFEKDKSNFSILMLPDDKANTYLWGYGGASDISLQFIYGKGLIYRQYGEGMVPPNITDMYYDDLIVNLYSGADFIPELNKLNIKYIILRNDFNYYFFGDIDNPNFIRDKLNKINSIKFIKKIGEWSIYQNNNWHENLLLKINSLNENNLCKYTVEKKLSTFYIINMIDCSLSELEFNTNYSKGWILINRNLKLNFPINNHGFMLFKEIDSHLDDFYIIFVPQLLLLLGMIVNFFCGVFLLYKFFKK